MFLLLSVAGAVLLTAGIALVLLRANQRRNRAARDDAHAQRLRLHAGLSAAEVSTFSVGLDGICRWYEGAPVPGAEVGRAEMLGRSAWHALAPWPALVAELRRALGGERVEARVQAGSAWLDCHCAPRFDARGRLTEIVVVLRNATAAHEHEVRIERLSEVRSRTLAVMNHRMRGQLSTLQGAMHLAAPGWTGAEGAWLATASEAGSRLGTFVEHLVDFLELDAARMTLVARPFSLREIVTAVHERYAPLASEHGTTLVVRYPRSAPHEFRGDAARVQQLLDLMLGTALRTNRGRQVVLNVDATSTSPERTTLAISVEDNGHGLAPEARGRIFEAFDSASAMWAVRSGGSGLELPIAGRLATLLGGAIEVDSRVGSGTTLVARFELERAWGVDGHAADEATREALPRGRVLLVDDDATSREVIAAVLAGLGQRVETAEHGSAALEALRRDRFDVVVSELHMPVLGGLELIEAAQALPEAPALVVLTADSRSDAREAVLARGARYLSKPASRDAIAYVLALAYAGRTTSAAASDALPIETLPGLERLRAQGDEGAALAEELVEAFLESSEQLMLAVSDAISRRDDGALNATLPLLETSSRLLGSAHLAASIDGVRDALEDGDTAEVQSASGRLAAAVRRLERQLRTDEVVSRAA